MVHVSDTDAGMTWYSRAFPSATRHRVEDEDFEYLLLGNVRIEIVPSDTKVSSGPAGTVVYWSVPEFEPALRRFLAVGAVLYRGPMSIEQGQSMCQVQDPWGNCIGLRGPNAPT